MADRIDFQRFYDCVEARAGHVSLGKLAKEIGVSLTALRDMLDGKFTIGLFGFNHAACGAFFATCNWLGVPASTFLIEDTVSNANEETEEL
jgi:hypothetical protein